MKYTSTFFLKLYSRISSFPKCSKDKKEVLSSTSPLWQDKIHFHTSQSTVPPKHTLTSSLSLSNSSTLKK